MKDYYVVALIGGPADGRSIGIQDESDDLEIPFDDAFHAYRRTAPWTAEYVTPAE